MAVVFLKLHYFFRIILKQPFSLFFIVPQCIWQRFVFNITVVNQKIYSIFALLQYCKFRLLVKLLFLLYLIYWCLFCNAEVDYYSTRLNINSLRKTNITGYLGAV